MQETTVSGYTARSILQFAAEQGADIETVCATTGIDPELLQTPDQRIPWSLHLVLWREAVKQTGDDHFGLHLGESFNIANFGIPGYVLLNCKTVGDVFEKLVRYTRLFCQITQIRFSKSSGTVFCECECDCNMADNWMSSRNKTGGWMTGDLTTCQLEERRYLVECTFASLLALVKNLTGKRLRLSAAWFQYAPPAHLTDYERLFQTELHFAQPTNRLVFDAGCLDWSILSSNAALLPIFESYADAMLAALTPTQGYRQKVRQAIAQHLIGELPTIQAIAYELAISVRHLQRELKVEGTSFQQLLDETRKELALQHLKNPATPIHDIAFLLGFSEPSAFNRAFKRWTGKTPGSYRGSDETSLKRAFSSV
ncbi:AraC family transcriptional regulator [Oscillatoria sp. FACHB-1407]|uniref:AraC family transcriptional regulator n=1 Tax=Oscillatoria sp. FACHB-1407 TaxID=2692847 RepID=UPI0016839C7F|nr:AraC family transcriptional regulator [Oscillatoria sp. FACHB-1407]MBD2462146.1 AraC family transcriptional regulator [Oscillatoria sp. FACHB-1407]